MNSRLHVIPIDAEHRYQFFEELGYYADRDGTLCAKVTYDGMSEAVKEAWAPTGGPSHTPFLGCTVDEVYDYFKTHLRPADDSTGGEFCTAFAFLVVDEACVKARPRQCILCCDAPDFGELDGETQLKRLRMPIENAVWHLTPLETLYMTPSEVEDNSGWALSTMPECTLMPWDAESHNLYRVATNAEARWNKRRAILRSPNLFETIMDDDMRAAIFKCPIRESKMASKLHEQSANAARLHGVGISLIDNRSKKPNANGIPDVGSSSSA